MDDRSGTWLTAKRLLAHGFLLALTLWSIYIWVIATPGLRDRNGNLKGTDFLHFYTLGSLAIEHRGEALYDVDAQGAIAARRVPDAAGIRYLPLYPPQVSLLCLPFAYFSYGPALALWWLCSAGTYAVCCYTIWRISPNLKRHGTTVFILALGFPAFFHLIAWGQTSAIALVCFTIFLFLVRRKRDFHAGLALGCLIFKPQLGLAAAILFLSLGAWKVILGAMLSSFAELSIGVVYYGVEPLRSWFRTLFNIRTVSTMLEPRPYQTHSLRTFWSMLIPWTSVSVGLYLISAVVILTWTIMFWKRSGAWAPRYGLLLLATVLVAPHLTVYDLVILAPAFLLLSDWMIRHPSTPNVGLMGTMLYLVYILPLIGPLAVWTHVQLSVVAMGVLAYLIMKTAGANQSQTLETPTGARVDI